MGSNCDAISSKRLLDKITGILNSEISKTYEEMDCDLVNECVDFLMEIEGNEKRLTKKEIQRNINAIPFIESNSAKAVRTFKRAFLSAACLAALLLSVNFAAMSFGVDTVSVLKEWRSAIIRLVSGESLKVDKISVIMPDYITSYKTIEEFLETEGLDILYPSYLPGNASIHSVRCLEYNGRKELIFDFSDTSLSFEVMLDNQLTDKTIAKADLIETVAGHMYYIINGSGFVQADFAYGNNTYRIKARDNETLIPIIEKLRRY